MLPIAIQKRIISCFATFVKTNAKAIAFHREIEDSRQREIPLKNKRRKLKSGARRM